MIKLYATYPYFTLIIGQIVFFLLCFLIAKKQRRSMLLSALLSAPFGFLSVFFVPTYWQPVRIAEWGATGIEDIIFSFANGGVVWFMATWPLRNRLVIDIQVKRMLQRFLIISISGIFFVSILIAMGIDPMDGFLLGMAVTIIIILLMRHKSWHLSVFGGIGFGLAYTIACYFIFAADPDFLLQWNLKALSGNYFLGVPLEEIEWSIAFGATWPLFMAYCFNAGIKSPKNSTVEKLS